VLIFESKHLKARLHKHKNRCGLPKRFSSLKLLVEELQLHCQTFIGKSSHKFTCGLRCNLPAVSGQEIIGKRHQEARLMHSLAETQVNTGSWLSTRDYKRNHFTVQHQPFFKKYPTIGKTVNQCFIDEVNALNQLGGLVKGTPSIILGTVFNHVPTKWNYTFADGKQKTIQGCFL